VSDRLVDLLDAIDRAMAALKLRPEARYGDDIENLLRVRRILEALDPDEIEALLEDEDEEE
jgi:hypothetical protein